MSNNDNNSPRRIHLPEGIELSSMYPAGKQAGILASAIDNDEYFMCPTTGFLNSLTAGLRAQFSFWADIEYDGLLHDGSVVHFLESMPCGVGCSRLVSYLTNGDEAGWDGLTNRVPTTICSRLILQPLQRGHLNIPYASLQADGAWIVSPQTLHCSEKPTCPSGDSQEGSG